ncbi:uncharacterized protein LOC116602081 [Nematostella vectensis]|uniref:uncharacterized protein LOC116602081 n=1 Tax=Nematostella vectensis TaxID=45351 RepID=UPI00138FB132|nr:uncharacterized protein LOC116602081 [Nematostella vectensis]
MEDRENATPATSSLDGGKASRLFVSQATSRDDDFMGMARIDLGSANSLEKKYILQERVRKQAKMEKRQATALKMSSSGSSTSSSDVQIIKKCDQNKEAFGIENMSSSQPSNNEPFPSHAINRARAESKREAQEITNRKNGAFSKNPEFCALLSISPVKLRAPKANHSGSALKEADSLPRLRNIAQHSVEVDSSRYAFRSLPERKSTAKKQGIGGTAYHFRPSSQQGTNQQRERPSTSTTPGALSSDESLPFLHGYQQYKDPGRLRALSADSALHMREDSISRVDSSSLSSFRLPSSANPSRKQSPYPEIVCYEWHEVDYGKRNQHRANRHKPRRRAHTLPVTTADQDLTAAIRIQSVLSSGPDVPPCTPATIYPPGTPRVVISARGAHS